MDTLTATDLHRLIEVQGKWCISLYMPAHPMGREQQQDRIRLRNLLARAEKELIGYGLRRPEVEATIQPAEELFTNKDFWQHQGKGLAIFVSDGFFATYRLPVEFEEMLIMEDNFHIKPLLPLINGDGKIYVLSLSLNQIKLYLATRDTIQEIQLTDMPTNMEDALRLDSPDRYVGFQTGTDSPGRGGERPAIFHGQDIHEDEKKHILRFFQHVSQGLSKLIEDESIPMVLVGVEYLLPIFREASTYNNMLNEGIVGNLQREDIKELHRQAWQIAEPIFAVNEQEARDRFEELNGRKSKLATSDLKAAVQAATAGQVETLFVPLGLHKWGRYDPEREQLVLEAEPRPENDDLLDFAAAQTILNSGQVYAVEPEEMPGDGDLAAILRYAV